MHKKKITILDIAKSANVSKSTVSRVINDSPLVKPAKRQAVLEAMDRLDFQPNQMARGLAGGRSLTIGVVTHDIGSPFYDSVAQAVNNELNSSPYSPIFADGQWNSKQEEIAIKTLVGRRVDGIILIGGTVSKKFLSQVQKRVPVIVTGRLIEGWTENCIYVDNFSGAYRATQYLIEQGHCRIAFIGGIKDHQDAIARKNGFNQALKESKIGSIRQLVREGNFRAHSGLAAAESLINSPAPFTAIFACNDEMAIGARLALDRGGLRVPDDISIVGFDDQPLSAYVTPPLTTVRQPADELGRLAAAAMMQRLTDRPFVTQKLSTEFVVRESVKRI